MHLTARRAIEIVAEWVYSMYETEIETNFSTKNILQNDDTSSILNKIIKDARR